MTGPRRSPTFYGMPRRDRQLQPIRLATGLVLAGAAAWLAKLGVIVATDGAQTDTGAAAALYLTGLVLLALGAAALGLWLARGRHFTVRIGAALLGPVAFFVSMNVLDSAAKATLDDRGPGYAHDEWGILFSAILWLGIGLAAVQRLRAE
jgi:thiol:disulfide interchange protein